MVKTTDYIYGHEIFDWGNAIAQRIEDERESLLVEVRKEGPPLALAFEELLEFSLGKSYQSLIKILEKKLVYNMVSNCLLFNPELVEQFVGTCVIEKDYFEDI